MTPEELARLETVELQAKAMLFQFFSMYNMVEDPTIEDFESWAISNIVERYQYFVANQPTPEE